MLPPATKAMREQSKLAQGRFTGDPSYEFEHTEQKKSEDGEEAGEEETVSVSTNREREREMLRFIYWYIRFYIF